VRPRFLLATLVLAIPLAAAAAGTASPPTVAQKQSEAARVLAELGQIDRQLSHTVDAYDGARVQLAALEGRLRRNRAALVRARRTLRVAQTRLERRMVQIYTSEQPTALDIYLATFLTYTLPLAEADCPQMLPRLRPAFAYLVEQIGSEIPPALIAHRAHLFETHLLWPIVLRAES